MARNTIGKLFTITSFGESHGPSIGAIVDGFPSNTKIDIDYINYQLSRRKPGQSGLSTNRYESDNCEILSGIFEGKSTGAPICFVIPNKDAKSKDYSALKDIYRPGHADYTYQSKYGNRDYNGGGRSSARITAGWVAAGALAESFLKEKGIEIIAYVQSVGKIECPEIKNTPSKEQVDANDVRCPDANTAKEMAEYISQLKAEGDSIGGKIKCKIKGLPVGLGEPVFGKFNALLSQYIMSINAVKSIEIGDSLNLNKTGSELSDEPGVEGNWNTKDNINAGLLGGITTGEEIDFTVGFKAPSSIGKHQKAFDTDFKIVPLEINGRHDPCVLPRAVTIVECMTAALIMDLYLENKTN